MWLIADHVAQELRAARAALPAATAEQRTAFEHVCAKFRAAMRDSGPRSLAIAGDTAEIRIEGVLTEEPDFWLWLMDEPNTAYEDLRAAIAAAETDNTIRKVVFYVDSPGGNVDGLFETVAAMQGLSKPSSVRARFACSAAYALAAVGGRIEAVNHAAMFGSIGVVVSYVLWDAVKVIDITSTDAPEKRPNPETTEGQASIRKLLDALHTLMVEGIAVGRGTTVEAVNEGYGRGAVMLAAEAKKAGMIDKISGKRPGEAGQARASVTEQPVPQQRPVVTAPAGLNQEARGAGGGAMSSAERLGWVMLDGKGGCKERSTEDDLGEIALAVLEERRQVDAAKADIEQSQVQRSVDGSKTLLQRAADAFCTAGDEDDTETEDAGSGPLHVSRAMLSDQQSRRIFQTGDVSHCATQALGGPEAGRSMLERAADAYCGGG